MVLLTILLLVITVPLCTVVLLLTYVSSKPSPLYQESHLVSSADEIAVLMPYQNNVNTIIPAVERMLTNSTQLPMHLVVINNCSSDGTDDVLREYLDRQNVVKVVYSDYLLEPSKAGALAAGLESTAADLVAFVDADVLLEPTALSRLVGFLRATRADVVSGFILYNSFKVQSLPAWDKCLSHGTIRLGRSRLGLCPNIPGQVVLARRELLCHYEQFGSFLEDLAFSSLIHSKGFQVAILPETVARESYPGNIAFLWRQRTRWLVGNFQVFPRMIGHTIESDWKTALGLMLHLPVYHVFPALIVVWLLLCLFASWYYVVIPLLITVLYALAAWTGMRNTRSKGTGGSLLVFALVFPWIHFLAWIAGPIVLLLQNTVCREKLHRFLYRRPT